MWQRGQRRKQRLGEGISYNVLGAKDVNKAARELREK